MSLMMWLLTNNRLAFCHALAWLLLIGGSHSVYAVDSPTQDGVKVIEAVKKSSWDKSGIDWLQWVVVNTQPATIAHGELMSDPEKLAFIAEFDPDMFDWWSGALMNRAYIATMRGIAADSSIEYEYESALHGVKYFEDEIYGGNGPGINEKGQRRRNNYGDFDMTHLSPKWHETVKNGIMRLALHGDMVCHDNLILGLHYHYAHFDDWSNRRFVAYMQERFSDDALRKLGFNPRSFHIRSYVREQRDAGRTNEMLIEDPIIHEFIRFYYVSLNGMLKDRYTRGACAFAAAELDVEKAVDAVLSVSTTQYGAIYLNGEKVATDNLPAGLLGEELKIPVSLKKGLNLIVIKTLNHWGDEWSVWASVATLDGSPLAVQLPVYDDQKEYAWAELREAQRKAARTTSFAHSVHGWSERGAIVGCR